MEIHSEIPLLGASKAPTACFDAAFRVVEEILVEKLQCIDIFVKRITSCQNINTTSYNKLPFCAITGLQYYLVVKSDQQLRRVVFFCPVKLYDCCPPYDNSLIKQVFTIFSETLSWSSAKNTESF